MWLRCRNSLSGHEASIPLDLVESGAVPDWTPLAGAEPSTSADEPTYNTTTPEPVLSGDDTLKENAHVENPV